MNAVTELNKLTYMHEHQPGCFNPHLVCVLGPGAGILDCLPHTQTRDICGYGKTFEIAAAEVLKKRVAIYGCYSNG